MKTKPRALDLTALFLVVVGLSLPVQIMVLYGDMPWELGAIAAKLAPLNWVVMGLSFICAALAYSASPWALIVAPALGFAVAANNYLVAQAGEDFSPAFVGFSTGAFFIILGNLFLGSAGEALKKPGLCWWRIAPRKRITLDVRVFVPGELVSQFETFDISSGGAFLIPAKGATSEGHIAQGMICVVTFQLDGKQVLTCPAEVVRKAEPKGHYPSGYGMRFANLSREQRTGLRQLLSGPVPQAV